MPRELVITNGDSAANSMKTVGIGDEVLPWRDVLHMGPVPNVGGLAALSELRARYLASSDWITLDDALEGMKERDQLLWDNEKFDRLTLWFEHDLYDQLQLLQILSFLAENPRNDGAVHLVQADDYLGVLTPEELLPLADTAKPVTQAQLLLATRAWSALGEDTPESWAALLDQDLLALPFLRGAVVRMLEELPDSRSGLSRTERQILDVIDQGVCEPRHMFGKCQELEEAKFMGDWGFFHFLQNQARAAKPTLHGLGSASFAPRQSDDDRKKFLTSALRLTDFGHDILAGKEDFAAHNEIDFWWGGTLVTNDDLWRWDARNSVLIAP